jgi:hypothetical protein
MGEHLNAVIEYQLEDMIDKHGLTTILDMISNICQEKAIHIESNWQDESAAKAWRKAGRLIDKMTSSKSYETACKTFF